MVILVIGGNGFIGRNLVVRLLRDAEVSSVVSMDVTPPTEMFMTSIRKYADKFHFVRGDVSQLEDILTAIQSFSVQKVVNLAYMMVFETEHMPRAAAKVNVLGMCNVFEAARLLGVSQVIYNSSNTVYGPQSEYGDREVTEEDVLHPRSTYGITKQLNEIMAARYSEQYGTSIIGLRICNISGHGREARGVVAKWFSSLVSLPAIGKPVSFEVAGASTHALVYVGDVVNFIRTLLHAPSPRYAVYNVAGSPTSLAQIAEQVRKYIPDAQIEFGREPGELPSAVKISCARAKEEFGFSPMPLEDVVLSHINDARIEAGLTSIKT